MSNLGLAIGWILTIFLGILAAIVVIWILIGKIDLKHLINDKDGYASLSRFQFLIFTFVVAMSLFYIIARLDPPDYPKIPAGILVLLGISGGSYVVSKGIDGAGNSGNGDAGGAAGGGAGGAGGGAGGAGGGGG